MNVKKEARKFINQTEIKEELDIAQRVWLEFHIIDLLEAHASSKMPSEKEMRDKYTDLREKHGLFDAFHHFRIWLISLAKPTKKP